MNTAEWIIVVILSVTLFVFLVLAIRMLMTLNDVTNEAKKVVEKGQEVIKNTNDVVTNIKGMTALGGVVQTLTEAYVEPKLEKMKQKQAEKQERIQKVEEVEKEAKEAEKTEKKSEKSEK